MGPEPHKIASVPARPRFAWDLKSPPWTDGKGSGEKYIATVKLWKKYHDKLPLNSSSKIPPDMQGIALKSQLYGRADIVASKISDEDLMKEDGALTLAKAIYKIDSLSKVTSIAQHFNELLTTTRNDHETLKNFEGRFEAQICRFNDAC